MAVQDPGRMTDFPCKECGMIYPNMPSLLEHMEGHLQEEEERKFKCDECGRGYRHAGSLANHKKTHEVGSFECDICGKENSNALSLKSHLRSHTSRKKYSCVQCGKGFRLASQLATHEKAHFTRRAKGPSYRKVDTEDSADEQLDKIENDHPHNLRRRPSSVRISTEKSPVKDKAEVYNLQAESSDDAGNRPFRCELCDKSYIHLRSLNNHKKTHQVGKFECTVCFKQFNNMAALYSHQRTHKGRSGTDTGSVGVSYTGTPQGQFSPQSQDAPVNFCHLCQVHFPSDEEFQEHIQMHNSSSVSFGLQDTLSDNPSVSYDNSIASPESNYYASPINNIPSVSSMDNGGFDHSQEQIISNGREYSDCSNNQTPSSSSTQGEPPVIDPSILDPVLMHTRNVDSATEMEESLTDSDERPFKCETCGKSYRHSGSLINHKRSHQVGIYQCSICRKSYPHLAALKSHLRLHKSQPSSFSLNAEGDWLSTEPLTLDNQQACFSSNEEVDSIQPILGLDQRNGANHSNVSLYHEQFNQDFSQDMTVHLPHNEHLMQRHMCADCGETFADIAGIKSHSCPLLQQQHNATSSEYESHVNFQDSNSHYSIGNPETNVDFQGLNGGHDQSYLHQNFHENVSSCQINGGGAGDDAEEEEEEEEEEDDDDDDDGDLCQCSICGNNYTSMRALRSHLRGHTQSHGTPASSGPSSMSSHEAKDEELGEMMICSTCGESFANKQDLISHQLLHNKDLVDNVSDLQMNHNNVSEGMEEAQSIICGSCGVFCTSYHHLENHGCTTERKDESTNCEEDVAKNVDQYEDASGVKETGDAEDRQYKCDQCGRSYRHAGSLLNHKKSHKTGVFRCLVCQKRFYNLLALKNHQRSHFDIKRHTCQECGKAFKIQKQLLNHLRRHKENQAKIQELNNQIQALMQMNGTRSDGGMQPLTSNSNQALTPTRGCKQQPEEETAETNKTLVKSEDTDDQRPFACDQCGRTYRHAGSLVNHRNSHKTGEYYCSVCNNSYSNKLAMKNHMRTHFAYKKHLCQKCGKGFRGKKQLLAHVCSTLRKDGARGRRGLRSKALKCKECKKGFISMSQLTTHTCIRPSGGSGTQTNKSQNKEERPFKCNICNRSYRHAGSLLNHKNTHKTGHFSCTFCSKPFTNPMALRNHTRIHTQKKKFVCLTCGKAFRLASILHNHQRVHNRVASHFSCPACGKCFQGRAGLKRHRCHRGRGSSTRTGVQQTERGDKCFMCDLCGRSYRHAGSLLNHKKTHSENLHHCTLCLQTFPDSLALQIHSQMKRHCCPECGKTFCLVAHLQSHMEVHSKDQAVDCSLCQQSFPNSDSYQQHHDMHHGEQAPYEEEVEEPTEPTDDKFNWDSGINQNMVMDGVHKQVPPPLSHIPGNVTDSQKGNDAEEKSHVCEHCGRTYRHAGSLLNHKNSHKTGSFFCSICQKEFTNLMALKNHRRIHTEPKRYQCLECGKAFRVSTQLICHRRIHTKEKPFACLLCDKSFSSKSNLRHHQKLHQNTQTYDSCLSLDADSFMDLDMGSFL